VASLNSSSRVSPTSEASKTLKARLARGAAGAFVINVGGTGLAFLSQLVLARVLGVEGYGIYAYVIAWVTILGLLATLGFHTALLRFASAYRAHGEWALLRGVIRYAEIRVLTAGLAIGAVGAVAVVGLGDRLPPELVRTFQLGFAIVPVLALLQLRSSTVRAFGGVISALAPQNLVRSATVLLIVAVAGLVLGWQLAPSSAMAAMLLGTALGLALVTLALRRRRPAQVTTVAVEQQAALWRQTALPLLFLAAMQALLARIDILILGYVVDTTSAGIYVAASRVAALVAFALTAVNTIFAPNIAALHARGDSPALQAMVTTTARWTTISGLAIAVPLLVLAPIVLAAFGDAFTSGATALRILLLGQIVNAATGSVGNLLTMTGHERYAAVVLGIAAVGQVGLCAILIPMFGMEGAAIATAATMIGWNIAMAVFVWRNLRIVPSILAR
jgi:O-antigen/teichoic acid export membrane protein